MKKILPLAILALAFTWYSCNKEEEQLLRDIERILPGVWKIDSMYLQARPNMMLHGNKVTEDTVIRNVGTIDIPEFDSGRLGLNDIPHKPIKAILEIDSVAMILDIEHLFLSGKEYFAYLRLMDTTALSTPQGKLAWEIRLFHDNIYLSLDGEDRLLFREASGMEKDRAFLSRE